MSQRREETEGNGTSSESSSDADSIHNAIEDEDSGHPEYQIGGWTLVQYVAEECDISYEVADELVSMFDDGKEVPFIARYRRNMIGDLEAESVHQAFNAYNIARYCSGISIL
uniref:Tex-like protein N-terminal domain-containing protein n=1 Tax=Plectus sambesii TaxID=2011161 RepID=A0A914X7V6_9BILA